MKNFELEQQRTAYSRPEINVVSVQTENGFAGSPGIEDMDYGYETWD